MTIERVKVHSPAIEGNLEGESADRDVLVVLPPRYAKSPHRRYPVIYALHGYSIGAEQWIKEIHVPQTVEGAFAKGAREMIVVFPDAKERTTFRQLVDRSERAGVFGSKEVEVLRAGVELRNSLSHPVGSAAFSLGMADSIK